MVTFNVSNNGFGNKTNIDYELRFNEDIEDLYNKQKIKIEFIKTNKIGQYS